MLRPYRLRFAELEEREYQLEMDHASMRTDLLELRAASLHIRKRALGLTSPHAEPPSKHDHGVPSPVRQASDRFGSAYAPPSTPLPPSLRRIHSEAQPNSHKADFGMPKLRLSASFGARRDCSVGPNTTPRDHATRRSPSASEQNADAAMRSAIETSALEWHGQDAAVRALRSLDDDLVAALDSRCIRFVDAAYIRAIPEHHMDSTTMPHRQHLERYCDDTAFMSPWAAVRAVRAGGREIVALTYGWATRDDPDPSGEVLTALRDFLLSARGRHVGGVFWDWPCLYQKDERGERTADEARLFKQALGLMSDVYASPFGTMVLRHKAIPPCPRGLDGVYNDRPYNDRGWCRFETCASDEVHEQAQPHRSLRAILTDSLPEKLIDIGPPLGDRGAAAPVPAVPSTDDMARRIYGNRDAIRSATFTATGDHEVVLNAYSSYVHKVAQAIKGVAKRSVPTMPTHMGSVSDQLVVVTTPRNQPAPPPATPLRDRAPPTPGRVAPPPPTPTRAPPPSAAARARAAAGPPSRSSVPASPMGSTHGSTPASARRAFPPRPATPSSTRSALPQSPGARAAATPARRSQYSRAREYPSDSRDH